MPALKPKISNYYQDKKPSAIRAAQILFLKRKDKVTSINGAIGNVTLPMHPAMQKRMRELGAKGSPFENGAVIYSATKGVDEANEAFLNILHSSGFETKGLHTQVTDGGSAAMELVVLGVSDSIREKGRPILLLDPAYTNYLAMAARTDRKVITITRHLEDSGHFSLPDFDKMEKLIKKNKPSAVIVIPYDNPTGQFMTHAEFIKLAKLAVKYDMWLISDEAYRELFYTEDSPVSVWKLNEKEVPGITGRRISIESASKVWNACGLRVGGLVTDNAEFNDRAIAEYTSNLCSNAIGQYIFGALAHESKNDLQKWYDKQRQYYKSMMFDLNKRLEDLLPGIIISSPDSAIYSVIDFRNIAPKGFDTADFVKFCASEGKVKISGKLYTLLSSPMAGFYNIPAGKENPGKTQIRLAYVETPEKVKLIPELMEKLFNNYLKNTK